jgi:hypothetical protein
MTPEPSNRLHAMVTHIVRKTLLAVSLPLLAVGPFGTTLAAESPDVQVVVTTQDAQGITQASFDQAFLKMTESWIVERTRVKAKEYLISIGKGTQEVKLISEATYIEKGAKKLMLVRISSPNGAPSSITVIGVIGQEVKRVLCARETVGPIPISYGPCGNKITEVFGVKF